MSIKVHDNLWVGSNEDAKICLDCDIVSLKPNAFHSAPRHLIIDMVDADSPKYFHVEQFDKVLHWIDPFRPTLIHCDKGVSRAPSVAMYYLAYMGVIKSNSYFQAYAQFKELYRPFLPNKGIREFMAENWNQLMSD